MKVLISILTLIALAGCENTLTRKFGGSMTVSIPCDQKVMNVTWKRDNMWYLSRPMELSEDPSILTFKEKSVYGAMEGQVILTESRCLNKE